MVREAIKKRFTGDTAELPKLFTKAKQRSKDLNLPLHKKVSSLQPELDT